MKKGEKDEDKRRASGRERVEDNGHCLAVQRFGHKRPHLRSDGLPFEARRIGAGHHADMDPGCLRNASDSKKSCAVSQEATPHFDYVAAEVSKGIASVSLDSEVPVIFGVLTTDNLEQALERSGAKSGNKGWSSALAAIETANLIKQI